MSRKIPQVSVFALGSGWAEDALKKYPKVRNFHVMHGRGSDIYTRAEMQTLAKEARIRRG